MAQCTLIKFKDNVTIKGVETIMKNIIWNKLRLEFKNGTKHLIKNSVASESKRVGVWVLASVSRRT